MGMDMYSEYKKELVFCPVCGKQLEKHIVKEGARYHVLWWDTLGQHCSEPRCEINHKHQVNKKEEL